MKNTLIRYFVCQYIRNFLCTKGTAFYWSLFADLEWFTMENTISYIVSISPNITRSVLGERLSHGDATCLRNATQSWCRSIFSALNSVCGHVSIVKYCVCSVIEPLYKSRRAWSNEENLGNINLRPCIHGGEQMIYEHVTNTMISSIGIS